MGAFVRGYCRIQTECSLIALIRVVHEACMSVHTWQSTPECFVGLQHRDHRPRIDAFGSGNKGNFDVCWASLLGGFGMGGGASVKSFFAQPQHMFVPAWGFVLPHMCAPAGLRADNCFACLRSFQIFDRTPQDLYNLFPREFKA